MNKRVYILILSCISSTAFASKFIIQNMTNYTLNGVFLPTNVIFTLKPKQLAIYDRGSINNFKIGRGDDATIYTSYQFNDASQNQDMKFMVEEIPGKGPGKKMLHILTQSMPTRSRKK